MQDPCRKSLRSLISVPLVLAALLAFGLPACSDSLGPVDDDPPDDSVEDPDSSLTYEPTGLGTLGGEGGWARGINARNEVVGYAEDENGDPRAFLWREGIMQELEGLGGSFSAAYAINDHGLVVGEAETADGEVHAVLWMDGEPVNLGTLGGSTSVALAVNNRGQVVGRSQTEEGFARPFLWGNGQMEELSLPPSEAEDIFFATADGINSQGDVVGNWAGSLGHALQEALLWVEGEPAGLPSPCSEAGAFDINDDGVAVGGGLSCPISTEIVPLRWTGGAESEYLEPLGGLQEPDMGQQNVGSASAVNAKGQAVGWSDATSDVWERDTRATLWNGEEPVDLIGSSVNSTAYDINEKSVAVGEAHGEPFLFVPGSEKDLVPARRAAARAAEPGTRPDGYAPGRRALDRLSGSRAHEAWAVSLCEVRPRVMSVPTVSEVLAGCG